MADRNGRARLLVAAAVASPMAALAFSAVIVLGWSLRVHPFWARPQLTLSEAAATRDAGEVVRLIEQEGGNPNASYQVREGVLGPAMSLSPLEAAVIVKRAEMVRLLLRFGASPTQDERRRLACAARDAGAGDVADLLAPDAAAAPPPPCVSAASR